MNLNAETNWILNSAKYKTTTDKIAPVWIKISNRSSKAALFSPNPENGKKEENRNRCPVEEIGKNSVTLSITLLISAFRKSGKGIV